MQIAVLEKQNYIESSPYQPLHKPITTVFVGSHISETKSQQATADWSANILLELQADFSSRLPFEKMDTERANLEKGSKRKEPDDGAVKVEDDDDKHDTAPGKVEKAAVVGTNGEKEKAVVDGTNVEQTLLEKSDKAALEDEVAAKDEGKEQKEAQKKKRRKNNADPGVTSDNGSMDVNGEALGDERNAKIRTGTWTSSEEARFDYAVTHRPHSWQDIAEKVESRTAKQCRSHLQARQKSKSTTMIKHVAWSEQTLQRRQIGVFRRPIPETFAYMYMAGHPPFPGGGMPPDGLGYMYPPMGMGMAPNTPGAPSMYYSLPINPYPFYMPQQPQQQQQQQQHQQQQQQQPQFNPQFPLPPHPQIAEQPLSGKGDGLSSFNNMMAHPYPTVMHPFPSGGMQLPRDNPSMNFSLSQAFALPMPPTSLNEQPKPQGKDNKSKMPWGPSSPRQTEASTNPNQTTKGRQP